MINFASIKTNSMKKIYFILFTLLNYQFLVAQVQQGGIPYSSMHKLPSLSAAVSFPEIDLNKLAAEDAIFDLQKDIPFRFGFNFYVNYNVHNTGEWFQLQNGDRIWRASFYSENAQSLNFLLENFNLASGASLFFYNEDKSVVIGSFTEKNNRQHHNLSTMPLRGEKITLEFYEPVAVKNISTFDITRVTHAYRSLKISTKAVDESGDCNNNVICAVGDNWRDQIRSVGIIIVNGNGNCTGALVNNTCEDKKPYFLTADHCTGSDVTTWNIGFNWESTDCLTNSGYQNINFQSINVLALRASSGSSDFALLELTQIPPASFNVFFAGWDISGNNPSSQVGIHHPRGDLKKISFDNNPASSATYSGAATWRISNWEDGTTEPGSSGSPLFDENKRIIGQLYGGSANCNNNINDYYGKIDVSWNLGLSDWLDPLNLNPTSLDGIEGSTITSDDVVISFLNKPDAVNCGANIKQEILLSNLGTNTATSISFEYGLDNNIQTYNWTGNLTTGQSETISLDKLILCKGFYNYNLSISSYNASIDDNTCNNTDNFSFEVINGSDIEVIVNTNFEEQETSFEIYTSGNDLLYSESNFGDNTSHTFNYCLAFGDYYFKMKDSGGDGLTSTFFVDDGFYSVSIDGNEIVNNDAFGSEEITNFHSQANGLKADFLVPDKMADINFNLLSNSSGNPQNFEWFAPNATNTSETNIIFNTSFNSVGNFPITLTISNDTACDFITKNITITKNTVAINTLDNDIFNLSIYPNPSLNSFILNTDIYKQTKIKFYNNIGKLVFSDTLKQSKTQIDVSKFDKGIYYLSLQNENNKTVRKLIVK